MKTADQAVAEFLGEAEDPDDLPPRLKQAVAAAVETDPDEEAELRRAAQALGVPLQTARNQPKVARAQARTAAMALDSLLVEHPKTANYLADPDRAKVAHDDVPVLKRIETVLGTIGDLGKAAGYNSAAGLTGLNQALLDVANTLVPIRPRAAREAVGAYQAGTRKAFADKAEANIPKTDNRVMAGVYSAGVSLFQNAPLMIAAGVTKNPNLALAGMGATTAGNSYSEAREKGKGVAPSLVYAGAQGAIEAATEKLPMEAFLGSIKAGDPLLKILFKQILLDQPGEQVATHWQDLNEWAALNPDQPFSAYLESRADAAIQTAVASAVSSGVLAGTTRLVKVTADRYAQRGQQAAQALEAAQGLEDMARFAEASRLRERDPQSFEQFVAQATEDGPVENVYISAEALMQSGVDVDALAAALPSIDRQLIDAVNTGGDLRIPLSEFSAYATGEAGLAQGLLQHLKTDPTGMSRAEAEAFMQEQGAALEAEVKQVMARAQETDAFLASKEAVRAEVSRQLAEANRFTPDVNDAYAALTADFYATNAQRLGITPEEMAARYPLTVKAQPVAEPHFDQEPAAVLTGEELAPRDADIKSLRDATGVFYKEKLQGQRIFNEALGAEIQIGRTGWLKARSASANPDKLRIIAALPEILAKAKIDRTETPRPGSRSRLKAVHHMTAAIRLRDDVKPVTLIVREDANGNFFYDLSTSRAPPGGDTSHNTGLRPEGAEGTRLAADEGGAGTRGEGGDTLEQKMGAPDDGVNLSIGGFEQGARGTFSPATSVITLLQQADLSTFLHESGHFYLETLADMASRPDAPAEVAKDMAAVLKWIGVPDLATWRAMTLDQQRDAHEQFARGFEAYLFEGKAPSQGLRALFQRFRSWLVNVYQSLKALNVELTDEVRSVFDRMLASEQEIADAEAAKGYAPLFENAEQAGMTPEEWQDYQRLGEQATAEAVETLQARSLRDMTWLSNAKSRTLRALQREAAAKRKAIRDEVTAEVMAEPVNRARQMFKHGLLDGQPVEGPHKLAIGEVRKLYEDLPEDLRDWTKLGYGRYGMLAEEGLNPDDAAELFGYGSGDALVEDLLNAEPAAERIAGLVDQRMLERYGDLTDADAIARAADEALHNEARLRFAATEANALAEAVGGRKVLASAARDFARQMVARETVRNLRPSRYSAAETRAAGAAAKFAKAGKLAEAAIEKRNQLINGHAARAAHEARNEVDKALRYFARFDGAGTRGGLDPDYRGQIDALLERFDLRRGVSLRAIDRRKSLVEWVEGQRQLGFEPVIPDALLEGAYRKHYKDMTVEELRGLVDSVRNIAHLGRLKKRLLTAKDDREFAEVVAAAGQAIRDNASSQVKTAIENNRVSDRVLAAVGEVFASHRKFSSLARQMDGFRDGGPLWEAFIRPMNAAGDREAVMREQSAIALHEIFSPIVKRGGLRRRMFIPEIGRSLSLEGRLSVALNWGNETNRMRVMDGDLWRPEQVDAILSTLTAEHWRFVQKVWDHLDGYWPLIAAKERRVSGVAPERVEAAPFTALTADGATVEMRGGYYPIKYDPNRSSRAEADTLNDTVKQSMQGLYTRATTRRGHTKARVETVERAMRKDLGVIFEHVTQVTHDLAWHEYLIDANRLLRAGEIDSAIRDHYGPEVLRTMRDHLEAVAKGELAYQEWQERTIGYLRRGATVLGLGWNLTTSLLQPLGLTQSVVRIGPKWVARGLSRWLTDAAQMQNSVAWVSERSEMMRLRARTLQREINEIRNQVGNRNPTPSDLVPPAVAETYFILIAKMQLVADMPTWLGQYEKSMAAGEAEDRAVALADQAVLDSQGGGQIKDLARVQRGSEFAKVFTNFYSYFNVTYNLMAESYGETKLAGPSRLPLLAADALLLMVIPSLMATVIKHAMKGEDWEELPEKLAKDQISYMLGLMVGLREVGAWVSSDGRNSAPAGQRAFGDFAKLYQQMEQGELDEALASAAGNAAGVLFHFPTAQVDRTVRGFMALADGKTKNPLVLVGGPPRE